MSERNLQLIGEIFEQFNRTGQPPTESMCPDVEWVPLRDDPDFEVHRGADSVHEYLTGWGEAFAGLRAELLDTVASGDKVFVWVKLTGTGRASGLPIEMEEGIVYSFRDGRISGGEEFVDRANAEQAAGIGS